MSPTPAQDPRFTMYDTDNDGHAPATPDPDRTLPTAAFIGYRPFPPVMNLYANYSFLLSALKSLKLCGATEDDFLYLVEYHLGYTPRGPLNFGRGYYLRNGTSFRDPVLAATGEDFPIPFFISLFDTDTVVKLPPLDRTKNPRDMVDEVLRAGSSKEHGVTFGFTVEVGVKELCKEHFEWRKASTVPAAAAAGGQRDSQGGVSGHTVKTWYTLHRLGPSISSAGKITDGNGEAEIVAVLAFNHVLSFTHLFTLELKGAGRTGELGERWALMVVTTALGIHFLRQCGKTGKVTVGAAQTVHAK